MDAGRVKEGIRGRCHVPGGREHASSRVQRIIFLLDTRRGRVVFGRLLPARGAGGFGPASQRSNDSRREDSLSGIR